MKPTQWVPAIISVECVIGGVVAAASGAWGQAVYWFGGAILNIGIVLIP